MMGKKKVTIVKVMKALSPDGKNLPATIYEKNRAPIRQWLSPETREALSNELFGYFEAERIGNIYFIGERQRGGWSW